MSPGFIVPLLSQSSQRHAAATAAGIALGTAVGFNIANVGVTAALALIVLGNIVALLVGSFAIGLVGRLFAGIGTGVGFIAGSDYIRATVGSASAQGLYCAAAVGGGGLPIAVVPLTTPLLDWRGPDEMTSAARAGSLGLHHDD